MLAVLSRPSDPLAEALVCLGGSKGMPIIQFTDLGSIQVSVRLDRLGRPAAVLSHAASGSKVTTIINLYPFLTPIQEEDQAHDDFIWTERAAAWWALLAAFPGTVINRPSPKGLMPGLDRCMAGGIPTRPFTRLFRADWRPTDSGVARAVHDRRPFLVNKGKSAEHDETVELKNLQRVDPRQLRRFVLAGRHFVDLNGADVSPYETIALTELLEPELPALACVVVEMKTRDDTGGTRLIDYDPTPTLSIMGPHADRILSALLVEADG